MNNTIKVFMVLLLMAFNVSASQLIINDLTIKDHEYCLLAVDTLAGGTNAGLILISCTQNNSLIIPDDSNNYTLFPKKNQLDVMQAPELIYNWLQNNMLFLIILGMFIMILIFLIKGNKK